MISSRDRGPLLEIKGLLVPTFPEIRRLGLAPHVRGYTKKLWAIVHLGFRLHFGRY